MERFGPGDTALCFSVYTLIELRRRPDIWRQFIDFFRFYPFFLLKPHSLLIESEVKRYPDIEPLMPAIYGFSLLNQGWESDLDLAMRRFFGNADVSRAEQSWRAREQKILDSWLLNSKTFAPSAPMPNAKDASRYINGTFETALYAEQPSFVRREMVRGRSIKRKAFPTLVTMLYSMYYRLFDSNWEARPAEVTDVQIAAAVPHVDAFVSEAFQIEILRKASRRVAALNSVELVRAKDLGRAA